MNELETVVPMKPWWQSKTILAQILAGIGLVAGVWVPSVNSFIQAYFMELGSGWVFINTILRLITKDKVSIS